MPEDSSEDSLEQLFAGLPSSSSPSLVFDPSVLAEPGPYPEENEPDESVELYRTVSFVPLAVVLLALALLLQAIAGPSALGFVVFLSASAIAVALVGQVRRSQALPLEDSEAGDEES